MKSGKFGIDLQHGIFNWWQHFGCSIEGGMLCFGKAVYKYAGSGEDGAETCVEPNFIVDLSSFRAFCGNGYFCKITLSLQVLSTG